MIKLLHTADVHLDSPLKSLALRDERLREKVQAATRLAFVTLVDHAIAEEVSAFLIAGDLFDGAQRSAKTVAFLTAQFDRLNERNIRVFYIKGNHDAENPLSGDAAFPENVHVFSGRGEKVQLLDTDIWIHGVSFSKKHVPESLLDKYKEPSPSAINIGMLHTSLAGSSLHDNYAPCSVAELSSKGFDYWALGHIHKRYVHCESPWIVMPGIPQGRDMGEAGAKSATMICVDGNQLSIEPVATSVVEFLDQQVDISDAESEAQVRQIMRDHCRHVVEQLFSDDAILRLTLTGRSALRWKMIRDEETWLETFAEMAEETGRLWAHDLRIDLEDTDTNDGSDHAIDELARLMKDLSSDAAFTALALSDMDSVLSSLPANQRAMLLPEESSRTDLINNLTLQAAQNMLAAMKSRGH